MKVTILNVLISLDTKQMQKVYHPHSEHGMDTLTYL